MAGNGAPHTRTARAYLWTAGLGLSAFCALVAAGAGRHGPLRDFVVDGLFNGLLVLGTIACGVRATRGPPPRAPWVAFTVGAASWTLGNLHYTIFLAGHTPIPFPSVADFGYLGLYPALWVGLILLVSPAIDRSAPTGPDRATGIRHLVLDGVVAGTAVAALACALVGVPSLSSLDGGAAAIGATLAYALADAALLGFAVALLATTSALQNGSQRLVLGALIAFGIADGVYIWLIAHEAYAPGGLLDALWPAALLLLGAAALGRQEEAQAPARARDTLAVSVVFTALLGGLLLWDHFDRLPGPSALLAVAGLAVAIARMALTARDNAHLAESRREARTDPLTGLGNRRALMADLSAAVHARDRSSKALVLFDLDEFKSYNDTFGHLAGDALLTRLAHALQEAMEPYGRAYRMGGDEFCALVALDRAPLEKIEAAGAGALSEHGEGFSVTTSCGAIRLTEHQEPTTALRSADRRLYAHKRSRTTGGNQVMDALLRALEERTPEGGQMREVAALAGAVAARLELPAQECDDIVRAAQLHDVGKLGIPEEILAKPGPLQSEEWAFVRRHTQIGERLLGLVPNLSDVARLVRASHERYDGSGYPDGLAGEDIPIGARIIAACDAYHAMTSPRPYRHTRDQRAALAELRTRAGDQFDAVVVQALAGVLERDAVARPAVSA